MENNELKALIKLLDDTDPIVYDAVKIRLLEADENIIPDLQSAVSISRNQLFIERTAGIINNLRYRNIDKELNNWVKSESNDLLYGSFLIAKYQYPKINFNDVNEKLNKIINDLRLEINLYLTGLQQIRKINHTLYNIHRFTGDFTNIINPDNSYVNKVLERKKSNDISIAILYIHIAQKLGLPVYGINFPRNFLLAFIDEKSEDTLFYINPFNKGAIITKKDIEAFLKNHQIKSKGNYFEVCSNYTILKRLLKFLVHSYSRKNNKEKLDEIKRILLFFEK
ncbi:MAG: transglutaminase-like domain-containing protein [Bacteroidales bacterium]|nr:transglutaminase-like domain-containing protein [Bacteroidales bacterium]